MAADFVDNVVNFTNSKVLGPGKYSIDVKVNWTTNDIKEYTLSLYSPKKVNITNVKGVQNERNSKLFDYTFNNTDARANLSYIN